jgi:hypothetical protein
VARAVHDPGFIFPVSKIQRDHSGPQIMENDLLSFARGFEEQITFDICSFEMSAESIGKIARGHWTPLLIDENISGGPLVIGGADFSPRAQSLFHSIRQGPSTRIVGLVFIERHCAKLEIKILPLQGARFLGSRTLAILPAVEDAITKRHVLAGEKLLVFLGIDPPAGLGRAPFRDESTRERVAIDHMDNGLCCHRKRTADMDRDLPSRVGAEMLRERAKHAHPMLEGERHQGHLADDREDVVFVTAQHGRRPARRLRELPRVERRELAA